MLTQTRASKILVILIVAVFVLALALLFLLNGQAPPSYYYTVDDKLMSRSIGKESQLIDSENRLVQPNGVGFVEVSHSDEQSQLLYQVTTSKQIELDKFTNSEITPVSWSPDSRYLAIIEALEGGDRVMHVYDMWDQVHVFEDKVFVDNIYWLNSQLIYFGGESHTQVDLMSWQPVDGVTSHAVISEVGTVAAIDYIQITDRYLVNFKYYPIDIETDEVVDTSSYTDRYFIVDAISEQSVSDASTSLEQRILNSIPEVFSRADILSAVSDTEGRYFLISFTAKSNNKTAKYVGVWDKSVEQFLSVDQGIQAYWAE